MKPGRSREGHGVFAQCDDRRTVVVGASHERPAPERRRIADLSRAQARRQRRWMTLGRSRVGALRRWQCWWKPGPVMPPSSMWTRRQPAASAKSFANWFHASQEVRSASTSTLSVPRRTGVVGHPRGGDRDQRLGPQELEVEAVVAGRGPGDRGIETAVEHTGDLDVTWHDPFVDRRSRAHRSHELVGQPADVAEAQRASRPGELALRGGAPGRGSPGRRAAASARRWSGSRAGGRADEQRRPEARLECLDLLRERRGGDVQSLGRAAEVELLGDGDEVAQLAQFHCAQRYATVLGAAYQREPTVVAAGRGERTLAA